MRRGPISALVGLLAVAACTPAGSSPAASSVEPSASGAWASGAAPSVAPSASEATIRVEMVGDVPVFDGSLTGQEWVLPAAVTWAADAYHLWGVTFDLENSVAPRGYYAASADGLAWTVAPEDPLATIALDTTSPGPVPGSVILEPDGTWVMYLWAIIAPADRGADLYRATAPAPGGPWTVDPEATLRRGSGGWDGAGLDYPSVVRTDAGYHMLYSGSSLVDPNAVSVGVATSPDGIAWTKESEPVIGPGLCGAFDARSINIPRLRLTDAGWLLFYNGLPESTSADASVGVAESADGFRWACASPAPALTADAIPDSQGIHVMAVAAEAPGPEFLVESLGSTSSALWLGQVVDLR